MFGYTISPCTGGTFRTVPPSARSLVSFSCCWCGPTSLHPPLEVLESLVWQLRIDFLRRLVLGLRLLLGVLLSPLDGDPVQPVLGLFAGLERKLPQQIDDFLLRRKALRA